MNEEEEKARKQGPRYYIFQANITDSIINTKKPVIYMFFF